MCAVGVKLSVKIKKAVKKLKLVNFFQIKSHASHQNGNLKRDKMTHASFISDYGS